MIRDAMRGWIGSCLENGRPVPEPVDDAVPAKFLLRLPMWLHRSLTIAAQEDGVSLNQYIVAQLARGIGAREAEAPRETPERAFWHSNMESAGTMVFRGQLSNVHLVRTSGHRISGRIVPISELSEEEIHHLLPEDLALVWEPAKHGN
jgi:hypothetical protein